MIAGNKRNEISITRLYDAPLKLVWEAWTDTNLVAKWWGPRGFTLTTHSKDLRDGGHWNYTMHGPDGVDYPNKTKYLEVVPFAKLVYDHGANDEQGPLFRVTVVFSEFDEKTKMEMTMALPSAEAAKETRVFIKKAGGEATWDRLAEFLEEKHHGRPAFVINRSFDVALETMFDLWTKPEQLCKWLSPTGFTMSFKEAEIRTGGESQYAMSGAHFTMYGRASYLDVSRPNRLTYTQQFCDANGNVSRHPGAPIWPETMLTTVQFANEGVETTRVTVLWEPYGDATKEEVAAFLAERPGMTIGWTGSFDKLEETIGALATT